MSITVHSELSRGQKDELHELYQNEWWTENRERNDIDAMLNESDVVIGLVEEANEALVGFARVLTDTVYKALIFDFIVRPDKRGTGLGEQLMHEIIEHPDLADVMHFELYCLEELVPFYEQWDFTDVLGELRLMRRE